MITKLLNWLVTKNLRPILVNWKTTLLGVLVLLASARVGIDRIEGLIPTARAIIGNVEAVINVLLGGADGQSIDIATLKVLFSGIGSMIGAAFIFAKDGNKSTETSTGATPPKALPE